MATISKRRDAGSGKYEEVTVGNVKEDGSIYLIHGDYESWFGRVTADGNISNPKHVWGEVKLGKVTPDGVVYEYHDNRSAKDEPPDYREYRIGKVTRDGTVYEYLSYADGSSKEVAVGKVDGTSNIYHIGAGALLLLKHLND